MTNKNNLQKLIVNEFASQYLPDELPLEWDELAVNHLIPEMAYKSSNRLRSHVEKEDIQELVSLLRDVKSDPENDLTEKICGVNMVDWREDIEDWQVFEKLISLIIEDLKVN
jgi:hypothetical protein